MTHLFVYKEFTAGRKCLSRKGPGGNAGEEGRRVAVPAAYLPAVGFAAP